MGSRQPAMATGKGMSRPRSGDDARRWGDGGATRARHSMVFRRSDSQPPWPRGPVGGGVGKSQEPHPG